MDQPLPWPADPLVQEARQPPRAAEVQLRADHLAADRRHALIEIGPKQNPFYLDLPFDDVNDPSAFRERVAVIPWAHNPGYAGHAQDSNFSSMKNRWVQLSRHGRTCYGQIEDAGPGDYHDAKYVFASHNERPANRRYGGAGLDVSPALNGCLAFTELNGDSDRVSWRFVDAVNVPPGPWKRIVTKQGVDNR